MENTEEASRLLPGMKNDDDETVDPPPPAASRPDVDPDSPEVIVQPSQDSGVLNGKKVGTKKPPLSLLGEGRLPDSDTRSPGENDEQSPKGLKRSATEKLVPVHDWDETRGFEKPTPKNGWDATERALPEQKIVSRQRKSINGAPGGDRILKRRMSAPAAELFKPLPAAGDTPQKLGEEEELEHAERQMNRADRQLIRQMTRTVEDYEYTLANITVNRSDLEHTRGDDLVRTLLAASEEQRKGSKTRQTSKLQHAPQDRESLHSAPGTELPDVLLSTRDWIFFWAIVVASLAVVIAMCIWAEEGLLNEHGLGHVVVTKTRAGHLHSRLYTTPATVELHGTSKEYFEVRLVAMSTKAFDAHRRLSEGEAVPSELLANYLPASWRPRWRGRQKMLRQMSRRLGSSNAVGNLTYVLRADGVEYHRKTLTLRDNEELEHFKEIDVAKLGRNNAKRYTADVTAVRSDGHSVAFLLQVLRMPASGKYKVMLGIIAFIITFIGIVSEKIHRSYCAFLGASVVLCLVAAIQETPHLHTITGMIDFGTLMLLFSMMILMRMLAVTGFFNWFAVKVVSISKQNPKILFYMLTNICGIMSMVLDNVTCVLLTGPLTFSLCKKMKLNPRPLYLAMTICATVGGTATLIGDPPNIVIGLKMKIRFEKFIIVNMPIVVVILPLCSYILYYRLKDALLNGGDGSSQPKLDLVKLSRENKIVDPAGFAKLSVILGGVLLGLLLSPIHEIEPGWFTVLAMFACAMIFEPHEFGKYLEFVEWDTLLFFALLFVLVESLAELGVIRQLGDWIIAFIEVFPKDAQTAMSLIIILWVSSIGSAFLESLPYTTTMVYIIIDLIRKKDELDFNPELCTWPLSVGACVGGIGSIMGSSANLVCMAVSKRFGEKDEERVQGGDFLKYGLPTMLILVSIVTVYQLILFVAIGFEP